MPNRDLPRYRGRPHTQLSLTITDTEDPTCGDSMAANAHACSFILVTLYGSRGNYIAQSALSEPMNGVPVPVGLSCKLAAGGTYYAVVSGALLSAAPIPYSLSVDGSPNVQWPPPCIVPRLPHDTSLGRAKRLLASHDCAVGTISHEADPRVRRGDVIGLRPGAGTFAPYRAPVHVIVSGR